METDPGVVVMGEDVHRLNGGTNGATRGLADRFPGRILGTPISENAFAGLAGGVAIDGRHRPVVEFMYADFMWVAADQLFNQIGKARHMYGGDGAVPLRAAQQGGDGHRLRLAALDGPGRRLRHQPGLAHRRAHHALRLRRPHEHRAAHRRPRGRARARRPLHQHRPGPVDDWDYCLPVGKASVRRPGSDVTVLTYLGMTPYALEAAEAHDQVDAEVIDLRWLDRASVDWELIEESLSRTNHVLIAEQGAIGTSYGGWLADEIHRRFFDLLDAPVWRVTGGEASPSISKVLERAAIAQRDEVTAALDEIAD